MEQLLIIEDDIGLNQGLSKALKADDRQIISCQDLKTAKEQLLCGGDFLFALGFGFLFQPDSMERTFGNQQFCQFVHRFPVGSLCTAGCTALKHNRQFFKGGAVFP